MSWRDSTITALVSVCHHGSYAETYSRFIHLNDASQIQGDRGPIQRHGCWPGHIGAIHQEITPMTGTFKAILGRKPVRGTPQVRTDSTEGIDTVGIANYPHPLRFLKAGTDLSDLIVVRFPRLEERGGFVQDAGKKEAQRGQDNAAPKGRKAAPAHE